MSARAKFTKKDVVSIKKQLSKLKPETKEVITVSNNVTGNHVGVNNCVAGGSTNFPFTNLQFNGAFNQIAQGTDYINRLGREVTPYFIELELFLNGSSANVAPNPYRLIIYQDRGFNGTTLPDLSNILNLSTATGGEYQNIMASYNPDYVAHKGDRKNRFKILLDRTGILGTRGTTPSNIPISKHIRIKKYFKSPEVINYKGVAATDAVGGAIFYILMMGTSATEASNASAQVRTRILFTDT